MQRALVLSACTLAVASCSNGGNGLSKEEYARRADAICARYQRATNALAPAGPGLRPLARYTQRTLRLLERAIRQSKALRAPRDEAPLARRWLESLATLRRDVIAIRDAAAANDLAGVRRLAASAQRHDRTTTDVARTLGMRVCSRR